MQILLFCTDERATEVVRKALNHIAYRGFYLVESFSGPTDEHPLRRTIADDEAFTSDFIGASPQQCQEWALEKQFQDNSIEQDLIAIADERSGNDDTLLVQFYNRDFSFDSGEFGLLPREQNTWYDFRVKYQDAREMKIKLQYVAPDVTYPYLFGQKDELTDEHGVFNVTKVHELIHGHSGEVS